MSGSDATAIGSLLARAKTAIESGRLPDAETMLREVLASSPRLGPANYMLAVVAVRQGDNRKAIELLRTVVNSDANALEAIEWLANLLRDEGEVSEAMYLCRHLLQVRPNMPGAHATMGLCCSRQGNHKDAVTFLRRATTLAPNTGAFHFLLGNALREAGALEEARGAFYRAVTLDPSAVEPNEKFAETLRLLGEREEALKYLQRVAELSPSPKVLVQVAAILAELDRHREAEGWVRRALSIDPEYPAAHLMLGLELQDLGQFEEAEASYRQAIKGDPNMAAAYYEITRCRRILDPEEDLTHEMQRLVNDPATSQDDLRKLRYGLGKVYDDQGKYAEAMPQFEEANRLARQVQYPNRPFDLPRHTAWIDRLIETFTPEFFASARSSSSDFETSIFIVGMIRSGTTLTEQIVSSHPQVAAGGELPYWTTQERTNLIKKITDREASESELWDAGMQYRSLVRDLAGELPRLTDKMPLNYLSLGLIHLLFPKARILHCRRDPVDTCLSIFMTPFGKGAEFCYDRTSIVGAYRQYQRLMDHWRRVIPADRFLDTDYEAMVGDKEGSSRRIVEFCGLPWDDEVLASESNERAVRTPSRWQVRQPVYRSSVERWRRYEPWLGELKELLTAR